MTSPETTDDVLGGRLTLRQHKKGYRFGLDAVLLATDLPDVPSDACIGELGAGQGAVSCVAAQNHPGIQLICIERQEGLAALLRHNLATNGFDGRSTVIEADLRDRGALPPHTCDLVLANPPYYAKASGLMSSNTERAEAHYELHGGLADFVAAAQYILKPGGWLKAILPPYRLQDLTRASDTSDLGLESLRFFHSRLDEPAYLVEIRARRGKDFETQVRAPLVVYADNGEYAAEVHERLRLEQD